MRIAGLITKPYGTLRPRIAIPDKCGIDGHAPSDGKGFAINSNDLTNSAIGVILGFIGSKDPDGTYGESPWQKRRECGEIRLVAARIIPSFV